MREKRKIKGNLHARSRVMFSSFARSPEKNKILKFWRGNRAGIKSIAGIKAIAEKCSRKKAFLPQARDQ